MDKQIKMDTNTGCKIDLWYFMVGLIGLKSYSLKLRVLIKIEEIQKGLPLLGGLVFKSY
jgi:hypothetical protein